MKKLILIVLLTASSTFGATTNVILSSNATYALIVALNTNGGFATNAPWPKAGTNTTASTNGLTVTINGDVSHQEVVNTSNTLYTILSTNAAPNVVTTNDARSLRFDSITVTNGITGTLTGSATYLTLTNIFDVKTYGAKGGVYPDDQTGIQAAIDAAQNAGGGLVRIPAGTYLLGTNFTHPTYLFEGYPAALTIVSNNITIVGDGMGVTVLKQRPGYVLSTSMSMLGSDTATNILIANLTFDGSSNELYDCTEIYTPQNFKFQDVEFKDMGFAADAIDTQYGKDTYAWGCHFSGIQGNIYSGQDELNWMKDCTIHDCASGPPAGLIGVSSDRLIVEHCRFERVGEIVDTTGGGGDAIFDNCYFYATNTTGTNFMFPSIARVTFRNCVFAPTYSSTSLPQIWIMTNRVATFDGCRFTTRWPILASGVDKLTVINCEFGASMGYGIKYEGGNDNGLLVANNVFTGPTLSGIRAEANRPWHGQKILNNVFESSVLYYGDIPPSTNCVISGNVFKGNGAGISAHSGGYSTWNTYVGNQLLNGTSFTLEGDGFNFISGSYIDKIDFAYYSYNNNFVGNTIKQITGVNAAVITNSIQNCRWSDNTVNWGTNALVNTNTFLVMSDVCVSNPATTSTVWMSNGIVRASSLISSNPPSLFTNTAPADTGTVRIWLSITNMNSGQVFKVPAYQ